MLLAKKSYYPIPDLQFYYLNYMALGVIFEDSKEYMLNMLKVF